MSFQGCDCGAFKKRCKKFHTKEEKWELSRDAFLFTFTEIWWYVSKVLNISRFVYGCTKTSSKYVIIILIKVNDRKVLLKKAEKASGSIDMP